LYIIFGKQWVGLHFWRLSQTNLVTMTIAANQGQGCQMINFQTKNHNSGNLWRALDCKMLVYFMVIWNILRQFDIVKIIWECCGDLVHFPPFGHMRQEKSGNPDRG
jgi:hypothetical protein